MAGSGAGSSGVQPSSKSRVVVGRRAKAFMYDKRKGSGVRHKSQSLAKALHPPPPLRASKPAPLGAVRQLAR